MEDLDEIDVRAWAFRRIVQRMSCQTWSNYERDLWYIVCLVQSGKVIQSIHCAWLSYIVLDVLDKRSLVRTRERQWYHDKAMLFSATG